MDAAKEIFSFIESAPKGKYQGGKPKATPYAHMAVSKLLTPVVAIGAAELPPIAERITAGTATKQDAEKLLELSGALWSLWQKVTQAAAVLDAE